MATTRRSFYIKTDEIKILADAINRIPESMPKVFDKALYEIAEPIFQESQLLVPVDTGALRASGNIQNPKKEGNRNSVSIFYGGVAAPYALFVHENLYAKHASPTQAKYLEAPLYRWIPTLVKNLAITINHILRNELPR